MEAGEQPIEVRAASPAWTQEIYDRSMEEGRSRMSGGWLRLASRSFIAGFNIVFGIAALGVVYALVEARFGPTIGDLAGSIAFGLGLVLLVVGRSELFSENFLDPVVSALEDRTWGLLARLWIVSLVVNLLGGVVLALILSVPGAMPDEGHRPLVEIAEEILRLPDGAAFARAIAAGAVLTLLTWLVAAAPAHRVVLAWSIGAFVALGPFNHVVVTELHLVFGQLYGVDVTFGDYARTLGIAVAGNMLGGIGFVTLAHLGQVKGS